ncbi:MAG: aminomethyltransferase beta-barrel domain-containing protein, partial [Verrucomicrobiales bacterium]
HGVASPGAGRAYVVVGKKAVRNELVRGWDGGESPGLYARECLVGSLSWVNGEPPASGVEAQPRYRAKAEPVRLVREGEKVRVLFERAQRAVTPGQICAFYEGGRLLGGGVFEEVG